MTPIAMARSNGPRAFPMVKIMCTNGATEIKGMGLAKVKIGVAFNQRIKVRMRGAPDRGSSSAPLPT